MVYLEDIGRGKVIVFICSGISLKTLRLPWEGIYALDDQK